jgi:hypothetical protein
MAIAIACSVMLVPIAWPVTALASWGKQQVRL